MVLQNCIFFDAACFEAMDLIITTSLSELNYSVTFVQETYILGVFIPILLREKGLTNFAKSIYFVQNQVSG